MSSLYLGFAVLPCPMLYFCSPPGALVSGREHLSWLDTIRTHLAQKNLMLLSASCFGHFLRIPDIQFQGQLYAALLRTLSSSLARMRLSFRINDRIVEFGPREFSLITGVSMEGWVEPPTASAFHQNFFHGRTDLLFCDIQKSFVQKCVATGGESRDAFLLALLYILYGILLIRAQKGKKIDLKYLHLADDLVKFNYYGWGQVAYEFLVRTTHRAQNIMDNLIAEEKNLAFDANGFAIALQIWAYEVMPDVARACAWRVPDRDEEIPRMLRWTLSSQRKNVQCWLPSALMRYFMDPCHPPETSVAIRTLLKRVTTLEHTIKEMRSASVPPRVHGAVADVTKKEVGDVLHAADARPDEESHIVSCVGPEKESSDMESQCVDPDQVGVRRKRIRKGPADVVGHVIATRSMKLDVTAQHDPRDMVTDYVRLNEFQRWYKLSSRQIMWMQIGSRKSRNADNGSHVDSLINLILIMLKDSSHLSAEWAALEMICWGPLTSENFEAVSDKVKPYALGHLLKTWSVEWERVKNVCGVGNIDEHWVTYEVILEAQIIRVYDPLYVRNPWEPVLEAFEIMSRNIPKLVAQLGILDQKGLTSTLQPMWDVVQVRHPLQQPNNFDCGIMVIKYLECLLNGRDVSVLDGERCGIYRRSLCAKLYGIRLG
ncbi:hypothetical protein C2S52_004855 [Perilla frutescens var. hirtella]|nr:hypothetical protein C2S52_004855 [Perilla frutescens var. hirtella]